MTKFYGDPIVREFKCRSRGRCFSDRSPSFLEDSKDTFWHSYGTYGRRNNSWWLNYELIRLKNKKWNENQPRIAVIHYQRQLKAKNYRKLSKRFDFISSNTKNILIKTKFNKQFGLTQKFPSKKLLFLNKSTLSSK